MKIGHRMAIFLSGTLWLAAGVMLMTKGIHLLMGAKGPLVNFLLPIAGHSEQAVLGLAVVGLGLGTMKGRTVLARAARKMIERIKQLPNPFHLSKIYPARYYILLAGMISLGMIRRFSGVADDIGGVVDLTIGCALVQGAVVYYKSLAKSGATYDTAGGGKS